MLLACELAPRGLDSFSRLCHMLLRHCRGGDLSESNITLVSLFLGMMDGNRQLLFAEQFLFNSVLFLCLRLVADHGPHLKEVRQLEPLLELETRLACDILREKAEECSELGLDLVRCLEDAVKVGCVLFPCSVQYSTRYAGMSQARETRTDARILHPCLFA